MKSDAYLGWVSVDFGVLLRALFVPLFVLTVTEHGTVPILYIYIWIYHDISRYYVILTYFDII